MAMLTLAWMHRQFSQNLHAIGGSEIIGSKLSGKNFKTRAPLTRLLTTSLPLKEILGIV